MYSGFWRKACAECHISQKWRLVWVVLVSLRWRADIVDLGLNNLLYLESPTSFLKNGLKSSSLQSYITFFHIFPLNYSKWSISIKIWKERKKMNLKFIYWKNPWSEVWARTYIFQNCHQVDKNPCSQFRHTSQNFVLLLATACTSTKDVNELAMARSKFISYIPR